MWNQMQSIRVCHACDQVEKQWDKLFDEVCIKYEEACEELQKVRLQLSIEKSKQNIAARPKLAAKSVQTQTKKSVGNSMIGTKGPAISVQTQTEATIETTAIQSKTTAISVQTQTEATIETFAIRSKTSAISVQTQTEAPAGIIIADQLFDESYSNPQMPAISVQTLAEEASETIITHPTVDHSYADPQTKKYRCDYCEFKSKRKYNLDKHVKRCTDRLRIEGQHVFEIGEILHECSICAKMYSYDQLRKHYLHFIRSASQRKTRNGHENFSKEHHELLLTKLKESKNIL